MRDVDRETLELEELLSEELSLPPASQRRAAQARALSVALDAHDRTHRRGIGAAISRCFVRSSTPAWRMISDVFETPRWNEDAVNTVIRLCTSLFALTLFCATVLAVLMLG